MTLKSLLFPLVWATSLTLACANTAPTVVIQSAAMRPGTTLMDVVYRVNDPDDATVKTRALAFVDGVRSFANVLKPVTFVEGTAAKLGDAIPSNTNHTLTWDVGADWNVGLGQVKFEVLAMDGRGLLPIDWITIPAAGGKPLLTISKNAPSDADVLNGLFWQFGSGDSGLVLVNGVLSGSQSNGVLGGLILANAGVPYVYGSAYLMKRMNLDPASLEDEAYARDVARGEIAVLGGWHVIDRPYSGVFKSFPALPTGAVNIDPRAIIEVFDSGGVGFALKGDGTVSRWGLAPIRTINGKTIIMPPGVPEGLTQIKSLGIGSEYGIAIKSDGTAVGWGVDFDNQSIDEIVQNYPGDFEDLAAVSAAFALVRKNGTVVVGPAYESFHIGAPTGGVRSIAGSAGPYGSHGHFMALLQNGTVHGWGFSYVDWEPAPPFDRIAPGLVPGIDGAIAVATGFKHVLALKADGTVVAWGDPPGTNIPAGLDDVTAIAVSTWNQSGHAWKADGTFVSWGDYPYPLPANLTNVKVIETGGQTRVIGRQLDP